MSLTKQPRRLNSPNLSPSMIVARARARVCVVRSAGPVICSVTSTCASWGGDAAAAAAAAPAAARTLWAPAPAAGRALARAAPPAPPAHRPAAGRGAYATRGRRASAWPAAASRLSAAPARGGSGPHAADAARLAATAATASASAAAAGSRAGPLVRRAPTPPLSDSSASEGDSSDEEFEQQLFLLTLAAMI